MTKTKGNFTLLEIVISIAILTVVSLGIGWKGKSLYEIHLFNRSIDHLVTDLRLAQLVALSTRNDIEIRLEKKGKRYFYTLHTDDNPACLILGTKPLGGIKEIQKEGKAIDREVLYISTSGRITEGEISFFYGKDKGVVLDLSTPLCIELKRLRRSP